LNATGAIFVAEDIGGTRVIVDVKVMMDSEVIIDSKVVDMIMDGEVLDAVAVDVKVASKAKLGWELLEVVSRAPYKPYC
jgi:hypothetical protein